jgi:hypothetical protein
MLPVHLQLLCIKQQLDVKYTVEIERCNTAHLSSLFL